MFLQKIPSSLPKHLNAIYNVSPKRLSSHFIYTPDEKAPVAGPKVKMNMFQAINNALDLSLQNDESAVLFGEDVAFGGVFRCSMNLQVIMEFIYAMKTFQKTFFLQKKFGKDRVFNTPLCEQGIAGMFRKHYSNITFTVLIFLIVTSKDSALE